MMSAGQFFNREQAARVAGMTTADLVRAVRVTGIRPELQIGEASYFTLDALEHLALWARLSAQHPSAAGDGEVIS